MDQLPKGKKSTNLWNHDLDIQFTGKKGLFDFHGYIAMLLC